MQIQADHYGINVADLDRSIEFYRDKLGFDLVDRFPTDNEKQGQLIGIPGTSGELAFIDTGEFEIELIEYDEPPSNRVFDSAEMHDIGIAHLCFKVDDVDEWYDSLEDEIEFETEPLVLEGGVKITYFYDPDGNQLELLEEDVEAP